MQNGLNTKIYRLRIENDLPHASDAAYFINNGFKI